MWRDLGITEQEWEQLPTGACLGYRSFDMAERTIQGVEAVNMMRKGQVKRLDRSDAMGQARFVESLFGIAA